MSEHPSLTSQPSLDTLNRPPQPRKWVDEVWIHITKHVGVGVICSVAYFDPYVFFPGFLCCHVGAHLILSGNWGVDLQAGSDYGYKLLFVILLAGLFAVILQVFSSVVIPRSALKKQSSKSLACKLGVVTGLGQLISFHMIFYPRPLTLLT